MPVHLGGTKLRGTEDVERLLSKAAKRSRDLKPVLEGQVDKSISFFFRRQFATEGAAGGKPWKRHSPRWARRRFRAGGARGGILWDTGRLRGSLVKVGPESVREVDRDRLVRGTTVPYAEYHQEGQGVPQREIVPEPLPRPLVGSWLRLIERWVEEGRS